MKATILPLQNILFLAILCSYNLLLSQTPLANEVQLPESSPFALGQAFLPGIVENSVQEVSGRVNLSLPIATIAARGVSYPVTLNYDGNAVFKQAQQLNQYRAQSPLGVGWKMQRPRVAADHKGTAARDDDEFYLTDGNGTTRLICTKKSNEHLDFEMEQYRPYKVRYQLSNDAGSELWEITDDNGITYIYGATENAKENVLAWGNWIGDSKNPEGATPHTSVWHLSKIEDQWGNSLSFTYEKVNHKINSSSSITYTNASYIKEITSSTGGRIVFEYGEKDPSEYYEPHKEQPEPDAYQEQFETKYLTATTVYDNADQEVYTYTMGYNVVKKAHSKDKNRYLQSITQTDDEGNSLPPVALAYHTSGSYEGGVEQLTYPSGGSVTYTYQENTVFDATNPPVEVEGTLTPGYHPIGQFVGEDYTLQLMRKGDWAPVDPLSSSSSYQMKVVYDYWVGQGWKRSEFMFLEPITVDYNEAEQEHKVKTLKFVAGKDFFAFLAFDSKKREGSVYLVHKAADGVRWKMEQLKDITYRGNFKMPFLMAGEHFVGVVNKNKVSGLSKLHTYVWNGDSWNSESVPLGAYVLRYGAANNFILTSIKFPRAAPGYHFNDKIRTHQNKRAHKIYYLTPEKRWRDQLVYYDNSFFHSYEDNEFYNPSNSMAGFVHRSTVSSFIPSILTWDAHYQFKPENSFNSYTSDTYQFLPVMNNMFVLAHFCQGEVSEICSIGGMAVFDGTDWNFSDTTIKPPVSETVKDYALGHNAILTTYVNIENVSSNKTYTLHQYDPNTNKWATSASTKISGSYSNYFAKGFFVLGHDISQITNTGKISTLGHLNPDDNSRHKQVAHNNLSGVIYRLRARRGSNGLYSYLDKKDGTIKKGHFSVDPPAVYGNLAMPDFGLGTSNYMSSNILYAGGDMFKRLVESVPNQEVKNITVSKIAIDNGAGEVRYMAYTYANDHTLPDDQSTFYGEVTVQNKGYGDGNIGKTKKYFLTGKEDVRLAGIPTRVLVEDKDGNLVSETKTEWQGFPKDFTNTADQKVGIGFYLRPMKTTEKLIFEGQDVITETQNTYNALGQLTSSSRNNSEGETETTATQYAYENHTAVKNKNMLAFPDRTTTQVDGKEVAVERSIWKSEDGKVYAHKNESGVTTKTLRRTNEITKVDDRGNVLESNNGQGIYTTMLYGYGDHYPIATITNAKYDEVMSALTVSYTQLQNLDNTALEAQLTRLYEQLPQGVIITIDLYDTQGRAVRSLDARGEAVNFTYDAFGRSEYTTDANGSVLEKREYNYGR